MCYPCNCCNRCGKFNVGSPLYVPTPAVFCLDCGGTVDEETGRCSSCGRQILIVKHSTESPRYQHKTPMM